MRRLLIASMVALSLTGCASTTTFKSVPSGADVFIDNVKVGKTPCEYSDAALMGSSKPLRVALEGYKPIDTVIRKDKAQAGPIVGACLFVVTAPWMLGYQKEYVFTLEKVH